MRKTLILMAGLIVAVVLLASCGTLTTEVTYTFKGDGANPKVGETVRFESSLVFDLEEYDENQEFVCEVKKHKKFYGETYTLKDKHAKKHSKHVKKLKFNKSDGLEDRIEDKLNRTKKTYEWDFDADGITDSTKKKPKHVFTEPGTYWVSVYIVVKNNDKRTKDTYGDITAVGGVKVIVDSADVPPSTEPYIGTWEWLDGIAPLDGAEETLYSFTFDSDSFELSTYSWWANPSTENWEVFQIWAVRGAITPDIGILDATVTDVWLNKRPPFNGSETWVSTEPDWGIVMSLVTGQDFIITYSITDDTMNIDLGSWLKWGRWQVGGAKEGPKDFTRMP